MSHSKGQIRVQKMLQLPCHLIYNCSSSVLQVPFLVWGGVSLFLLWVFVGCPSLLLLFSWFSIGFPSFCFVFHWWSFIFCTFSYIFLLCIFALVYHWYSMIFLSLSMGFPLFSMSFPWPGFCNVFLKCPWFTWVLLHSCVRNKHVSCWMVSATF